MYCYRRVPRRAIRGIRVTGLADGYSRLLQRHDTPRRQPAGTDAHALDWRNPDFYDEAALNEEQERIFDICHGCRRCVSLCGAFPTLFDLVDESATMEVDGVDKKDYWKVVDQCYLCDLCYMTSARTFRRIRGTSTFRT